MHQNLISISGFLTERETAFVEAVFRNPDCKYPGGDAVWNVHDVDDNEPGVWIRPEQLGMVVCVGTYKWQPAAELQLGICLNDPNATAGVDQGG